MNTSSFPSGTARAQALQDRLVDFAVQCCRMLRAAPVHGDAEETHVVGQLVRSATAPAAHYAEARHAHTRREFVHRMRYSLRELRETEVWLRMFATRHAAPAVQSVQAECSELIAIFVTSIRTAERGVKRRE